MPLKTKSIITHNPERSYTMNTIESKNLATCKLFLQKSIERTQNECGF